MIYKTSQKGIDLIKEFEGFVPKAYICPAGIWTIGYGTTKGVRAGMTITKEKAEELLKEDVRYAENAINKWVKVKITQSIFDALVSFVYNVGEGAFSSSTLLKKLNEKKYAEAGDRLLAWNKANGKVLEGLSRRRIAERKLFYAEKFPV